MSHNYGLWASASSVTVTEMLMEKALLVNRERCVESLEPVFLQQNLPCSGGLIKVWCKDRRIVREGGSCDFVSAFKCLEVGIFFIYFAFLNAFAYPVCLPTVDGRNL